MYNLEVDAATLETMRTTLIESGGAGTRFPGGTGARLSLGAAVRLRAAGHRPPDSRLTRLNRGSNRSPRRQQSHPAMAPRDRSNRTLERVDPKLGRKVDELVFARLTNQTRVGGVGRAESTGRLNEGPSPSVSISRTMCALANRITA